MSNDIEKRETFDVASVAEQLEELREALEGEELTRFDLPQARVPTGGATSWNMGEDEDPKREIVGIYLGERKGRTYWESPMGEGEGGAPDCQSDDGVEGTGEPGGLCSECPLNEWGSDSKGRGKACKEKVTVFLLEAGAVLPTAIVLPTGSLGAWKRAKLHLINKRTPPSKSVLRFALEKAQSKDGISYARVKVAAARSLEPAEFEAVRPYRDLIEQSNA